MYAKNCVYDLIGFLEEHNLGWTGDESSTIGRRFVDNMSLFQCGPFAWTSFKDKHNNGAASLFACT